MSECNLLTYDSVIFYVVMCIETSRIEVFIPKISSKAKWLI